MEWEVLAKILAGALGLVVRAVNEKGSDELKADVEHLRVITDAIDSGDVSRLREYDAKDALDRLKLALFEHDLEADDELHRRFPKGTPIK